MRRARWRKSCCSSSRSAVCRRCGLMDALWRLRGIPTSGARRTTRHRRAAPATGLSRGGKSWGHPLEAVRFSPAGRAPEASTPGVAGGRAGGRPVRDEPGQRCTVLAIGPPILEDDDPPWVRWSPIGTARAIGKARAGSVIATFRAPQGSRRGLRKSSARRRVVSRDADSNSRRERGYAPGGCG
jgi:hypothetical protein